MQQSAYQPAASTQPAQQVEAADAVLLVNLGTPDAPTAPAVRRYLAQFLSDRRVVSLPPLLWQPVLRLAVLPLRSARVARLYDSIWLPGGSPLQVHTAGLAAAIRERLPSLRVEYAMRYGQPALDAALERLRAAGVRRVLVLPLYPQYSTTTTASVEDMAADIAGPAARVVHDYHADPGWVAAMAGSIQSYWDANGRGDLLLLSFHGIPQRLIDEGDPYFDQCVASTAAIRDALGLGEDQVGFTFQSRFGREQWLQPYTDQTLRELPARGVRRVDVACPGFAVDCLETLEEIALQNAELFRSHGGQSLHYIPCLNDSAAHADALAALAQRELQAWQ